MLHSQRRLISEGRVFPSHSMEAVVYLSEVNCLQGKQSQPCLQPSRWDGVTVDAGVSRHSLHEMKIGFDPPGWEIQMRNLLVSRIYATNLNLNTIEYAAFKHGQSAWKVAIEMKFLMSPTGTWLFFWLHLQKVSEAGQTVTSPQQNQYAA